MSDLSKNWRNFVTNRTQDLKVNTVEYMKAAEIKDKLYRQVERLLPEDSKKKLEELEDALVLIYAMHENEAYKLGFIDGIRLFK